MSHSWLDSVPNNPPQHHARRTTAVRESSDGALVTGQTRSCASPQKSPSPHERVMQDYRNQVASNEKLPDRLSYERFVNWTFAFSRRPYRSISQWSPLQDSQPYPSRATGTCGWAEDFVSQ
ncbi:hypothetical protein MRX96_011982 [Rhipicephalus microplus]